MKTRKTVITVLAVTLLVSAALIVGCMNQLDGLADKDVEDNYPIPEGKGIVRIKFVDSNAKTILPVTSLSSYTYNLYITQSPGGAVVLTTEDIAYGALVSDVYTATVNPGTNYKVSFVAKNSSGIAVGGWNNGDNTFNITSGGTTSLNAVLTPYQTGQGTFTYNITEAGTGTTAFDIINISNNTTIGNSYPGFVMGTSDVFPIASVSGGATGTITLPSSFYLVKLTVSGTNTQTIQYIHALHIYEGLNSSHTQDLSSITNLAVDRFDVTYDFSVSGADTSGLYSTGNPETVFYAYKITQRTPTFAGGYTFGGFYKTNTGGVLSNEWNFSTDRVFAAMTLYAKSNAPGTPGSLALTVTFPINEQISSVTGNTTGLNKATILNGTTPLVITAPNGLTNIEWLAARNGSTVSLGSSNPLIFDNNSSDSALNFINDNFIITLTGKVGDATYSLAVPISFTP